MKIAIVQVALSHGGAERVGVTLANGLLKHNHEIIILTDLNEPVIYHTDNNISIYNFNNKETNKYFKWFNAIIAIRKIAKREKPDIFIGIMGLCSLITYLACFGLHIPIIMTEHYGFERPSSVPFTFEQKLFKFHLNKLYTAVTVLTEADKKVLKDRFKNITVMPNPLFLKPIDNIPQKENIVLAAGRIDDWHYKGFDILIKSWKRIQDLNDNENVKLKGWWLKIAGSGKPESFHYLMSLLSDAEWKPADDNLQNEGRKPKGIENHVAWISEKYHIKFLGYQKDIESLYKKSEIFVLSSRYEAFGLVLIEAMSQGCAPIACDFLGRQKEIITSSKEGLTCEPEDVEALAVNINKLIADEALRKRIQVQAIERSKHYQTDIVVLKWDSFLQSIKEHC